MEHVKIEFSTALTYSVASLILLKYYLHNIIISS